MSDLVKINEIISSLKMDGQKQIEQYRKQLEGSPIPKSNTNDDTNDNTNNNTNNNTVDTKDIILHKENNNIKIIKTKKSPVLSNTNNNKNNILNKQPQLENPQLESAQLEKQLEKQLEGVQLENPQLEGGQLEKQLEGAQLEKPQLEKPQLEKQLEGAQLEKPQLEKQLEGAQLEKSQLEKQLKQTQSKKHQLEKQLKQAQLEKQLKKTQLEKQQLEKRLEKQLEQQRLEQQRLEQQQLEQQQLEQQQSKKDIGFVLSCFDHRFISNMVELLKRDTTIKSFDYFVLAGGSLGFLKDQGCWADTCMEHIKLANQFHNIKKIVIIDHEDCEVYKHYYNDLKKHPRREKKYHINNLTKITEVFEKEFKLNVDAFILNLDGSFTKI